MKHSHPKAPADVRPPPVDRLRKRRKPGHTAGLPTTAGAVDDGPGGLAAASATVDPEAGTNSDDVLDASDPQADDHDDSATSGDAGEPEHGPFSALASTTGALGGTGKVVAV